MRKWHAVLALVFLASTADVARSGPIIIAGTDADDHGGVAAGANQTGWLFMQRAFENLASQVTNGQKTVVCLGCNAGTAQTAFESAFDLSSLAATWSRTTLTDPNDITSFFDGTGATNLGNTGIAYMPTVQNNVSGGLNSAQLAVINANGTALNNFLIAGGGLFTQEQVNSAAGYGWLTSLLPGLLFRGDNDGTIGNASSLTLTAAGNAAFPGLTSADLSNATPWHAWFDGTFGSLQVLVTGPTFVNGQAGTGAVVLGGGVGGAIVCGTPGAPPCPTPNPVPEPGTMVLIGSALAAAVARRRMQRS